MELNDPLMYNYFNSCASLYRDALKLIAEGKNLKDVHSHFIECLSYKTDFDLFHTVAKYFPDIVPERKVSMRDAAIGIIAKAVCIDIAEANGVPYKQKDFKLEKGLTLRKTNDKPTETKQPALSVQDIERLAAEEADGECLSCKI